MSKTITILGSGFSSLSAACYLAKGGHKVTVFEKNGHIGGRANQYSQEGFLFDMRPTGNQFRKYHESRKKFSQ